MSQPTSSIPPCASTEAEGFVNVREIMARIRLQARQANLREEEELRDARQYISSELLTRIARLHARVETIRENVSRIGETPPQPPTLRGRAGGLIVRLIHRSLFWLIPSLKTAHEQIAQALVDQVTINGELMKAIEQAHVRIGGLHPPAQEAAAEQPESGGGK